MEKLRILLFFFLAFGLFLNGCQNTVTNNVPVKVIIEGNGKFPDFLVGRWKADKKEWEITFESGGTIASVVSPPLGHIRIIPGKKTVIPMKLGGKGIYEPGNWYVSYSPEAKVLTVEIFIERLYEEIGGGIIEGSIRDFFVGEISEDYKKWQVDWISVPKYIVYTPDKPEPSELPVDPNDTITKLVFKKVRDKVN